MAGWSIESWSRELARGSIVSDAGRFEFDATVALVDDFAVGESVEIALAEQSGRRVVTRVAPTKFHSPLSDVPTELPARLVDDFAQLTEWLENNDTRFQIAAAQCDRLVLALFDDEGNSVDTTLTFHGLHYIGMPTDSYHFYQRVRGCRWADSPNSVRERLAIDPETVPKDAVLFSFEPGSVGPPAGFIVANSMDVVGQVLRRRS